MRLFALAACLLCAMPAAFGGERPLFVPVSAPVRTPIGWAGYCIGQPHECGGPALQPLDITMSREAWRDLLRVTRSVNGTVKPVSDMEHWGVKEKWSLPYDGRGDCEDYALQKRKILIDAGWPRQALLMTIVRDREGDGHAVLTVKSDWGELILDNKSDDVMGWKETGYRFLKRQSQEDPDVWVGLEDAMEASPPTALSWNAWQ